MGGRGASSSNATQTRASFINDLVKNYDEFTRGDLQGAVEAYAATHGLNFMEGDQILQEIDRRYDEKQNAQRGNNTETKAVYDSIQGKQDRYPTIGANTKNFDRIINNAVTIRHYDQDEMDVRNTTARTPSEVRQMQADIRRDLSRFGRGGRNGMRMYYSKDGDEFVLSYYPGYTYRIKLR